METVTGYVTGINGNLANVSFDGAVHKNEVAYILVDGKRLKGEVIRINNGVASMQSVDSSLREVCILILFQIETGSSHHL